MIYNPEGSAIDNKMRYTLSERTYITNRKDVFNNLAMYMCFIKNKTITIQNMQNALRYNKTDINIYKDNIIARNLNPCYRSEHEYHLTITLTYNNIVEYAALAKQADFIENISAGLALTSKEIDVRVFSKKDNPNHVAFICKIPNLNALSTELHQNICGVALNMWNLFENDPEIYRVVDNNVTINKELLLNTVHNLLKEGYSPEIKKEFEHIIAQGTKPDTDGLTKTITHIETDIERCYERIQQYYNQLNDARKDLFVAQHTDNLAQITAFIQGLECKGIELNAVNNSQKTFTITAYTILSNYSKEDAKVLLGYESAMWAEVMHATLVDERYSFKMHATFTFKTTANTGFDLSAATRNNIAYDIENSISFANPHIRFYNCYEANKAHILRALREQHYDLLTPLLKQTAGSFNVLDGPVWNRFKDAMLGIQLYNAKDYALWINNNTLKHMTMEEVYNEIHQDTK